MNPLAVVRIVVTCTCKVQRKFLRFAWNGNKAIRERRRFAIVTGIGFFLTLSLSNANVSGDFPYYPGPPPAEYRIWDAESGEELKLEGSVNCFSPVAVELQSPKFIRWGGFLRCMGTDRLFG